MANRADSSTVATDGSTVRAFATAFDTAAKSNKSTDAFEMVRIGVELEYQLCADFFRKAGQSQQILLFGKEFLALAGSIATAAIGVASAASGAPNVTAIAWTGLSAASGTALLNTVQRNFLFSEDNVQAVQELTLKAVSVARTQALAPERQTNYTFASGVSALIDVQAQCEVQNILVLVRQAILAANPTPSVDIDASITDIVKSKIGWIVLNGIPVSDEQLQMLFWLIAESPRPTDAQKTNLIYPSLSVLKPPPADKDNAPNKAFEPFVQPIQMAMNTLPPSTIRQIRANIAKVATAGDSAPVRFGTLSTTGGGATSGRIGVTVR